MNWEKSSGRDWSKLLAMVLVVDSNEHGQREASGVGRIKMLRARSQDEAKVTRRESLERMGTKEYALLRRRSKLRSHRELNTVVQAITK